MITFTRFLHWMLPLMCLINLTLANNIENRMAWLVAFLGWGAHLVEMRKHEN
jgi:hypothetical protein